MRNVLRGFAFLVLEVRVGAFVDEQLHQLEGSEARGVVQRSDIVEPGSVDVGAVLDEELRGRQVAVVGGFMQGSPA